MCYFFISYKKEYLHCVASEIQVLLNLYSDDVKFRPNRENKLIETLPFPSTSGNSSFEINKIFCYRNTSVILLNLYSDEVKFRPTKVKKIDKFVCSLQLLCYQ